MADPKTTDEATLVIADVLAALNRVCHYIESLKKPTPNRHCDHSDESCPTWQAGYEVGLEQGLETDRQPNQ